MQADRVIPVGLTANNADALNQVQISTGMKETDLMNRAIQLYAIIDRKLGEGFTLAFTKVDARGEVTELELMSIND
jgi:hypothetical protein